MLLTNHSPYITSVGATQVIPGTNILASRTEPEQACETVIYSGGGFSNVFPLPSYQKTAVQSWFKNHPPPYGADRFNNSQQTRGFPDISANGMLSQLIAHYDIRPLTLDRCQLRRRNRRILGSRLRHFCILPDTWIDSDSHQRGPIQRRQELCWICQSSCVPAPRSLQRHHPRWKPRLWHSRLHCCERMGSCDRIGNAKLSKDVGVMVESVMKGSDSQKQRNAYEEALGRCIYMRTNIEIVRILSEISIVCSVDGVHCLQVLRSHLPYR